MGHWLLHTWPRNGGGEGRAVVVEVKGPAIWPMFFTGKRIV